MKNTKKIFREKYLLKLYTKIKKSITLKKKLLTRYIIKIISYFNKKNTTNIRNTNCNIHIFLSNMQKHMKI